MKRLLSTLFLIFNGILLCAQSAITGTITDIKDSPIPGATVMIKGTYDGAITDDAGQFEIITSQTGAHILVVKSMGFDSQSILIDLPNSALSINVSLKESFNELSAVTISAGAFEASDKKKAVALNSLDMITVPGAQGSVVGALQYLPGTTTNGESGRLFVRGGSSRENQVFVDGALVPIAYNPSAPNTAVRSKFNPFMFGGTIFSTGGFSAEYGQALSSVLLLETKGIQEQDQLDISILSVGLGLAGTKKWENGAITVSLDHTNLGPYIRLVPQTIDWDQTPIANNAGLNFRQKTKRGLFKLYGTYNDSYFQLNRPDLNNEGAITNYKLTNRNYYANSSWKGGFGKNWIVKFSGSMTLNNDKIGVATSNYSEELISTHIKAVGIRKISKKVKLLIGAENIHRKYTQTAQENSFDFNHSFNNHTSAAFLESNIYLSKKWGARIGVRGEYANHINDYNISPRLSMAYQTSKHSQISIAAGSFYQEPKNDYLLYSNKLTFERADQLMLNFQWSKNKRTFRTEFYYKNYKSLVKFNPAPFFSPEHYTNKGYGHAQGVDLFFRDKKTIKNGDYWISYSFIDTKRNELNYTNEAVPTYASKHNVSIIYKHWIRKWRSLVGASFNYSSPRTYNDPNLSVFNGEKMKAYQSLNLNWSFLYRENVIFYGSVSNVLGYQQAFGYEFSNTPNTDGVYEKRLIQPPAQRFFVLGCFITLSKSGDKNQLDKIN